MPIEVYSYLFSKIQFVNLLLYLFYGESECDQLPWV